MKIEVPEGAYVSFLSKEQLAYNLEYHLEKHPEDLGAIIRVILDSNECIIKGREIDN